MPDEQIGLGFDSSLYERGVRNAARVTRDFADTLGALVSRTVTQTQEGLRLVEVFKDLSDVTRKISTNVSVNEQGQINTTTNLAVAHRAVNKELRERIRLQNLLKQPTTHLGGLGLNVESTSRRSLGEGLQQSQENQRIVSLRQAIQARYAAIDDEEKANQKRIQNQERAARQLKRIQDQAAKDQAKALQLYNNAQNAPADYIANIARRASSLFEVVSVFRLMDTAVQSFTNGLRTALDVSIRIGEIQTIDRAAVSYDNLFASVLKLSSEFGESPQKVSEALYQTVSNQIATGTAAFNFVREATRFSLATVTSVDKAVNTLSSTINSYNLDLTRTQEISANFFKTIELGRIRAEDFQASIGDLSNLAQQVGVSYQELNAAIALTTIQGVKPSEAFTRIRNILIKLIKPTEDMQKAFEALGYSSGDAAIQHLGFGGVLAKLEELTKGNAAATAALFGNIRAITGAFIFSGEGLKKYNSILAESTRGTAQYDAAVQILLNNTGKKLEISFQRIANTFTQIGNSFNKSVVELAENSVSLERALSTAAIGVGTLIAALAAGGLAAGLTSFIRMVSLATTATGAFALSLGGVVGLLTAVATAVAYASYAWAEYNREQEEAARAAASAESNSFLGRTSDRLAENARLIEESIRLQARLTASFIAERNRQSQVVINAAERDYERSKYFTDALERDFIDSWKSNASQVMTAYDNMKQYAKDAAAEISRAQADGITRTLDLQLQRESTTRGKTRLIDKVIRDLRQRVAQAAASTDLPGVTQLFNQIEQLETKRYSILTAVENEFSLRTASIEAERRINDLTTDRLNVLQQIEVQAKRNVDAQRQAALQQQADQNRISALSSIAFGFKPSDITGLGSVADIDAKSADIQAAIRELKGLTTDQFFIAKLNEQSVKASTLAGQATSKIQSENERNLLTQRTVAANNAVTNLNKEFIIAKGNRESIEAAARKFETEAARREVLRQMYNGTGEVNALTPLADISVFGLNSFTGEFKARFEARAAEVEDKINKWTAAQDEYIKNLEAAANNTKAALNIITGNNAATVETPTVFQQLNDEAIKLKLTFQLLNFGLGIGPSRGFAAGGRTDTVPAMLTPGEFVMNRNASSRFYSQLSHMNSGTQPRGYQTGGSIGDVTINIHSDRTPEKTGRAVARELRQIQRQNVR